MFLKKKWDEQIVYHNDTDFRSSSKAYFEVISKNFANLHRRRGQSRAIMFERKSGDIEAHRERNQRVPNRNCRVDFPPLAHRQRWRGIPRWRYARDLENQPFRHCTRLAYTLTFYHTEHTGTQTHNHTRKHLSIN